MRVEDNETNSAQVILRSPTGDTPGPTSEVTSRTLSQYTPSPDAASEAARAFEEFGFEVGPLVGIAFSITGPAGLFRRVFDVQLVRSEDHVLVGVGADGVTDPELPTAGLPPALSGLVASVVFEPPSELM